MDPEQRQVVTIRITTDAVMRSLVLCQPLLTPSFAEKECSIDSTLICKSRDMISNPTEGNILFDKKGIVLLDKSEWSNSLNFHGQLVHSLIRGSACIDLRRHLWDQGLQWLVLGDSNRWRGSNKYSGQLTWSIYSTIGTAFPSIASTHFSSWVWASKR